MAREIGRARACPPSTCMCQWSAHSLTKNDNCVKITVFAGHTLENPAPIDNLGVILHGSHFCRTPAPNPLHQGWRWGRDVGALGPLREPVSGGGPRGDTVSIRQQGSQKCHPQKCSRARMRTKNFDSGVKPEVETSTSTQTLHRGTWNNTIHELIPEWRIGS